MLDAVGRDRFRAEMRRPDAVGVSGFRRGAHRRARGAQREDVADAAQFEGRRDGAAGVETGVMLQRAGRLTIASPFDVPVGQTAVEQWTRGRNARNKKNMKTGRKRPRQHYDVVVCGGGTAGAIAGIAAARTGAKTLLLEQYGTLGGVLTLGMSLKGVNDGEGRKALGGVGEELIEGARGMDGATPV